MKQILQKLFHLSKLDPDIRSSLQTLFRAYLNYLFFSLVGLFIGLIRRYLFYNEPSFSYPSKVAVLGRGYSANLFFNQEFNTFTRVYLSNYNTSDLEPQDYNFLIGSKIILVSNICERIPNLFRSLMWNISEVIFAKDATKFSTSGFNPNRFSYRLNSLGVTVENIAATKLPNEYPWKLRNTGLISIHKAIQYCLQENIHEIYLFGYDFYVGQLDFASANTTNLQIPIYSDKNNRILSTTLITPKEQEAHKDIDKILPCNLDKLAADFPDILFYMHTASTYNFQSPNIHITHLDTFAKINK